MFDKQAISSTRIGINSIDALLGYGGVIRGLPLNIQCNDLHIKHTLLSEICAYNVLKGINTIIIKDTNSTAIEEMLSKQSIHNRCGNLLFMGDGPEVTDLIKNLKIFSWPTLLISCNDTESQIDFEALCEELNCIGISISADKQKAPHIELIKTDSLLDTEGGIYGDRFSINLLQDYTDIKDISNLSYGLALSNNRTHIHFDLLSAAISTGVLTILDDGIIAGTGNRPFARNFDEAISKIQPIHIQARLKDAIERRLSDIALAS